MKNRTKIRLIKNICIFFFIATLLIGSGTMVYTYAFNPYRGSLRHHGEYRELELSQDLDAVLTAEQAREDLAYFSKMVKSRHPMWLEENQEKTALFEERYRTVFNSIEDDMTVMELLKAAKGMAALLGDGHTLAEWRGSSLCINDLTQIEEYGMPVSINSVPTAELFNDYKTLASYEVDYYAEHLFQNAIRYEVYLRMLGIDTSEGVNMVFDTLSGVSSYHYTFVPADEVAGNVNDDEQAFVFYEIDKPNNLGIFTLKSCVNDAYYRKTLQNFFEEVHANGITNVAVDLRGNGGGNSSVANEFIAYLDVDTYLSWDSDVRFGNYLLKNRNVVGKNEKKAETFGGAVYILTDITTFSAAMDFAMLIQDNNLGEIVGEPSGNLPNSYGDLIIFQMPHSKLVFTVSYKKWYRIDQTKADLPIMPDYEVPASEALEKVYEIISNDTES